MGLFNKKEKSNKNGGFNFDEGKGSKLPDLFRPREISKKSGNERSVIRKSESFDLDKLTYNIMSCNHFINVKIFLRHFKYYFFWNIRNIFISHRSAFNEIS